MIAIVSPDSYPQGDLNLQALGSHLSRSSGDQRLCIVGRGLNIVSDNYGPTMIGVYREECAK